MVDIPEEEARYWTYRLEQMNALGADSEVGVVFPFIDYYKKKNTVSTEGKCIVLYPF